MNRVVLCMSPVTLLHLFCKMLLNGKNSRMRKLPKWESSLSGTERKLRPNTTKLKISASEHTKVTWTAIMRACFNETEINIEVETLKKMDFFRSFFLAQKVENTLFAELENSVAHTLFHLCQAAELHVRSSQSWAVNKAALRRFCLFNAKVGNLPQLVRADRLKICELGKLSQ